MNEQNLQRLSRQPLWNKYPELYEALVGILFQHDPVRICDDSNAMQETEYTSEVNTILPRLKEVSSIQELRQVMYEEFIRWFDQSAGPIERYDQVAQDIWNYIATPERQVEIAQVPDDLPNRIMSAIHNVSIRYPNASPQDGIRTAEMLRTYAERLEKYSRSRLRKLESTSEPLTTSLNNEMQE